jgi:hypothetical protein
VQHPGLYENLQHGPFRKMEDTKGFGPAAIDSRFGDDRGDLCWRMAADSLFGWCLAEYPKGRNSSRCCFSHEIASATRALSSAGVNFSGATLSSSLPTTIVHQPRAPFNRRTVGGRKSLSSRKLFTRVRFAQRLVGLPGSLLLFRPALPFASHHFAQPYHFSSTRPPLELTQWGLR